MYDAPRAATVIAKSPMKLWAMDRLTYKHIMMSTTLNKRNTYKEFLESVPLLKDIDPYERLKVADMVELKQYKDGEIVLNEGEDGDYVYIIQTGKVECLQNYEEGKEPGSLGFLTGGDYFGERAIMMDCPRACTVKAVEDTNLLALEKSSFQSIVGLVEETLKKRLESYKSYKELAQ